MFTEHAKLSTSMAKGEGLFWWRPMYVGGVEKELPCYKCPFRILGFHLCSAHSNKCLACGVAVKSIVPLCLHQFCASSFPKRFWLDDSMYWAFFRNIEDKCDSFFHSAVIWKKKTKLFPTYLHDSFWPWQKVCSSTSGCNAVCLPPPHRLEAALLKCSKHNSRLRCNPVKRTPICPQPFISACPSSHRAPSGLLQLGPLQELPGAAVTFRLLK